MNNYERALIIFLVAIATAILVRTAYKDIKPDNCIEGTQKKMRAEANIRECRKVWLDAEHTKYQLYWVTLYPSADCKCPPNK